MLNILTVTVKELLLLKRDKAGLLVLFIMPALLVMVITLVQENVMELTGQKKTKMLLLDLDTGSLGSLLHKQLELGHIEIIVWDGQRKSSDLQAAITRGDYQAGLIIPAGSYEQFQRAAVLFPNQQTVDDEILAAQVPVQLYFDPGIMPGLRSGLTAQVQVSLQTIGMGAKIENLGKELSGRFAALEVLTQFSTPPLTELTARLKEPLLSLESQPDDSGKTGNRSYSPVQQNVPAWALFGMFFTAIPIAGGILQERKSGIWIRLTSLPVSHLTFFSGKVLAYICVCFCQFLLIGLIGSYMFPYLALPAFTLSQNIGAVLLVILFSSLAACGLGIFLGMACNTYEQASTLGSTLVVAAAAIGGVMVPVYAMPHIMQRLSVVSPLNWGLTAFQDLLVRGLSFPAIWADLGKLALFFLLTILLSWKLTRARL